MKGLHVALIAIAAFACNGESSSAPRLGQLGGESVARVGAELLSGHLVAQVAARQGVSVRDALDGLVGDCLVASSAREAGLEETPAVAQQLAAAEARLVIAHAEQDALAAGPPTDAEVAELTKAHWRDFDLPEQMRVIHAVVVRPTPPDAAKEARGRSVAAAVLSAVAGAADAADFETRANAVPHPGFDLKVETLEPFVADGRSSTSTATYDTAFAAASAALGSPGATSGVVESHSGWHVIRLLERLPGKHVGLDERRAAFAEENRSIRANKALATILSGHRSSTRIEVANGLDDLLTGAFRQVDQTESVER